LTGKINEKKDKRIPLVFTILLLLYVLGWAIFKENSRVYNELFIGAMFLIAGLVLLIQRIVFDVLEKDKVIGELVRLERVDDAEGRSYTPYFKYRYLGEEREYKSNISSFSFRTLPMGRKEELLILRRKPSVIRVNRFGFHAFEYGTIVLFIGMGGYFILHGIALLG
jgi:hypothetical protein